MSILKKRAGYSISLAAAAGAAVLLIDRYAEFVGGVESVMSWTLPPLALASVAVAALVTVKLGHPSMGESDA